MIYNDTNLTAANNYYELYKSVNDISSGALVLYVYIGVLLFGFIISSRKLPIAQSLMAGAALQGIVGAVFLGLGWISTDLLGIPIAALVLSIIGLFLFKD